jgi:hypothetical protein
VVSEITLVRPFAVAEAFENETVPKLASGSTRQFERLVPLAAHCAGASAIHSADEVSSALGVRVLVNVAPVVASASVRVTWLPATLTSALTVSPGEIVIGMATDAAGISSYQAEYLGVPATQSELVPICSSPFDEDEAPPRPTQKLESFVARAAQVTAGCTHVPFTSENVCPEAMYPDQLLLIWFALTRAIVVLAVLAAWATPAGLSAATAAAARNHFFIAPWKRRFV